MRKGFTLIETLIYLALLAFVIGAGVSASYYIIDSSAKGKTEADTTREAEFLMRKIDWAMTGATAVNVGTMTITKGGPIKFEPDSDRARITIGGSSEYLTSERVRVTGLQFLPTSLPGITASSTIDGKRFEITKYIRK